MGNDDNAVSLRGCLLVGLAACARCGKDTVARRLREKHGFKTIAFADPIKRGAQQLFGLTEKQTWDDSVKEIVIPEWNLSPRQIFQRLGTEFGRETIHPDIWLTRARVEIERLVAQGCRRVCLTDIRFENEASMVRRMGGMIWHIERPGVVTVSAHKSENGVVRHDPDRLVQNDGSLTELYVKIDALMSAVTAVTA
jgi:hypothetical protein